MVLYERSHTHTTGKDCHRLAVEVVEAAGVVFSEKLFYDEKTTITENYRYLQLPENEFFRLFWHIQQHASCMPWPAVCTFKFFQLYAARLHTAAAVAGINAGHSRAIIMIMVLSSQTAAVDCMQYCRTSSQDLCKTPSPRPEKSRSGKKIRISKNSTKISETASESWKNLVYLFSTVTQHPSN